ncbi:MAG: DUF389 domain-containing protein [Nocardioidaceae bacterium]|nr:DUF389 domain-containing protein [Nocardioidaceae bacterium]
MLHVRVVAPASVATLVVESLREDPTVVHLVVVPGAAVSCPGDLVMFDLARENANQVLGDLRAFGVERDGSISIDETEVLLSDTAHAAERRAPGAPADAVIWDAVQNRVDAESRLSWSFVVFLTLAALIASVGRYLDQPILIVGAVVVGPEFAPVAAICVALATRTWRLLVPATTTLLLGFAIAAAVTWVAWVVTDLLVDVSTEQAGTGNQTQFIIQPDGWSLVVALLAGIAGILSLTASKSGTLVGVFISVTTIPAVGTIGLTLAVGLGGEAVSALAQLGINLAGLLLSGTLTLLVQRMVWRRVGRV